MKLLTTIVIIAALAAIAAAGDWSAYTSTLRYHFLTKEYVFSNDAKDGAVAATIIYDNSYSRIGWDYVHVAANAAMVANASQAPIAWFGMGFAEGYKTQQQIYNAYNNSVYSLWASLTPNQTDFILAQIEYINAKVKQNPSTLFDLELARWWQVQNGMYAGYSNATTNVAEKLTFLQFYLNSFQAEVPDVQTILPGPQPNVSLSKKFNLNQHCSALIKYTGDDLYMAHDTWSNYNTMLRQYKTYDFGDNRTTISMSSYPASLSSIDDWYMTSHQLAVTETTNSMNNTALSQEYVKTNTIPEFLRVMIANSGATSGSEWVSLFQTENSGTYCNQFMVVDMKLFTPNQTLPDGLLWVAEQLPGNVTSADVTHVLRSTSYWASYNIPYFPNVNLLSGNLWDEQQYGSLFSYTNYSRAEIFRAREGAVKDIDGMKFIMRYNNYTQDPFSIIPNCSGTVGGKCDPSHNPQLAIANRADLAPQGNASNLGPAYFMFTNAAFGAIDSKITSWSRMQKGQLNGVIICGPTYQDQPVFQWSSSLFGSSMWPTFRGMADRFDFPWVEIGLPANYNPPAPAAPSSKSSKTAGIVIGVVVGAIVLIGIGAFLYNRRADSNGDGEYKAVGSTTV